MAATWEQEGTRMKRASRMFEESVSFLLGQECENSITVMQGRANSI